MDIKNIVQKELAQIDVEKADEILGSFNKFKNYLAEKIEVGEKMGLSDEKLTKATELVASYLASHEEPRNREEKILMELWKSGSKEEQSTLAHILFEMVRKS